MQSRDFTLQNPSGLHARPASEFVRVAAALTSKISVEDLDRPGTVADGKSIIEVLMLGASQGHRLRVCVDGADEGRDIQEIAAAIASGLGEGVREDG